MVLFGESLTTLMQPGWEAHYIDYGGLKTIIAAIKQATKAQEQSVRSTQVTASKGPLLISASLPYSASLP
jgi:SPX domain protein involved in polyphosphate accumulation